MITFTRVQIAAISDISRDIAQIFFASVLIDPLITRSTKWYLILIGIFLALTFWFVSLIIIKK